MLKILASQTHYSLPLSTYEGPGQPQLVLMPSKLLILHGQAKINYFTVRCVPESMFGY